MQMMPTRACLTQVSLTRNPCVMTRLQKSMNACGKSIRRVTLQGKRCWRSATNYKRFFEFKKAVGNYLILADAPRFAQDDNRTNAIYNAAVLLENDQDYSKAAQLFLRYADQVGKPKDAAEAYFRAGMIYGKMNNFSKMTKVMREFPRRYGSVPGQAARAVQATFRIGDEANKRKQWSQASRYYRASIDEFSKRGLQPATDAAEFAAQAAFQLAERDLQQFLKIAVSGSLTKLQAREKKLKAQAIALRKKYDAILKYKRATMDVSCSVPTWNDIRARRASDG